MKIIITTAEDIFLGSRKTGISKEKIKRPSNSFLCFRTYFNSKFREVMKHQEKQCHISRMASDAWKLLSENEKRGWSRIAEEKSILHKKMHPLYKFNPTAKNKRLPRSEPKKIEFKLMDSFAKTNQLSSSSDRNHIQSVGTNCINGFVSPVEAFDCIVKELSNTTLPSSSVDEAELLTDGANIDFRSLIDLWINDEE